MIMIIITITGLPQHDANRMSLQWSVRTLHCKSLLANDPSIAQSFIQEVEGTLQQSCQT